MLLAISLRFVTNRADFRSINEIAFCNAFDLAFVNTLVAIIPRHVRLINVQCYLFERYTRYKY